MSATQTVTTADGYAYGAIGADVHVFGDGVPLYLLHESKREPAPDRRWLRQLPSRMLNARFALVRFTGRDTELAALTTWLSTESRLSVRWLHAPGGQGKSRLAAELAAVAAGQGWKVVTAVHGPGAVLPLPGSQDLSPQNSAGVLLVVDYADRWPVSHLAWLLRNMLLHHGGQARVMLLGRSTAMWPGLRAVLTDIGAEAAEQRLDPAPDRTAMFAAAYTDFQHLYDLTGPVPETPARAEDGTTLALHMAALVAVDARSRGGIGRRVSPEQVTLYLLDREHAYWAQMSAESAHVIGAPAYTTEPEVMNRTVFTAALAGRQQPEAGLALVRRLAMGEPDAILRDHGAAYPCLDGEGALEPLYPDRLAEDFLALTFPGHHADYPAQQWADPTARMLVSRDAGGRAPGYLARYFFLLGAVAQDGRWTHVRGFLDALLSPDPRLAVEAGGAALLGMAGALSDDTLAAIFPLVPDRDEDLDFALAAAELAVRLTPRRVRAADSDRERGHAYSDLSRRLAHAGRYEEALIASRNSQKCYARDDVTALGLPGRLVLAVELTAFAGICLNCGRFEEGLAAARRAADTFREGVEQTPGDLLPALAPTLLNLSQLLEANGHRDDAIEVNRESVAVYRELRRRNPDGEPPVATAMTELARKLCDAGIVGEAATVAEEAHEIAGRAAGSGRSGDQAVLAGVLTVLGEIRLATRRRSEAVELLGRALQIYQRLADQQPGLFEIDICEVLRPLAEAAAEVGDTAEAAGLAGLRVELLEGLGRRRPEMYGRDLDRARVFAGDLLARAGDPARGYQLVIDAMRGLRRRPPSAGLADALIVSSRIEERLGKPGQALRSQTRAVDLYRELRRANPGAYEAAFPAVLHDLGIRTIGAGSVDAGAALVLESLQVWEEMAAARPGRYRAQLASALSSAAKVHVEREEFGLARPLLDRARTLFGRLQQEDPQQIDLIRALADNLYTLGRMQYQEKLYADAVASCGEATKILKTAPPAGKGTELLAMLGNLAAMSNLDLGRTADAQRGIEDVVRTLRPLADTEPGTRYLLAGFLVNGGILFRRIGALDRAEVLFGEGIAIYQRLARRDRAAFGPHLARSLAARAFAHVPPGSIPTKARVSAAVDCVSEYEWLVRHVSGEHTDGLARALANAATLYEDAGMARRARQARNALARL
ncbi:hypothetical protein GCM10010112_63220 [Actinoplanes lobatus]|uniref:Tetratricopeptide (TPR) repeat protein n=1 Tax=Actinoplanes lobatus TaxID=113568 RepID=A0A7W7MJ07_9ACTN|nr:hypothetical protein [Actinoplanes lobatus]MBB4752132.1 tetratricopeptide (TPR) repeat protein [Actinoplanes lobatus]GGN84156.1 hypothetical protein GCM10010112_63220 [Actinoplanes lobatus]GIE44100.1 hypothetical protein Alo02nite_69980 [Actinoplanes lobatus]